MVAVKKARYLEGREHGVEGFPSRPLRQLSDGMCRRAKRKEKRLKAEKGGKAESRYVGKVHNNTYNRR